MQNLKYILLIFLLIPLITQAQTWRQYQVSTGITTNINFTYTSVASSGNTAGNDGVLQKNPSTDTARQFKPIDIVNDPNAYPWRMIVKVGDCSGVLIDPYHVLTAGHVVSFSSGFGSTKVTPAYALGDSPYSYAYPEYVYLLSDFAVGTKTDIAIIKLNRPLGSLTGWCGYGYNNLNTFFSSGNFYNPSYPNSYPFNSELLYNWKGYFENISTDFVYSYRNGFSGMSGSCTYKRNQNDNITYGILLTSGVKFNRITANKFDAINSIITQNTPTAFDAVPLYTESFPRILKSGTQLDSLNFVILNNSTESISGRNLNVKFYISTDSIISSSDELLYSKDYSLTLASKSSVKISETGIPAINKTAGNYWLGVIVSGDNNLQNNTTGILDVVKISISNKKQFTISGNINSSQSQSGISGITLSGFPSTVLTDYKGYYQAQVDSGWSGTVTLSKTGFTFSQSTFSISNITSNINQNNTCSKIVYTFSCTVKSPVNSKPIRAVQAIGLPGEPYTNVNGIVTANIYYGWSGDVSILRSSITVLPNYFEYSNTTSNITFTTYAGYLVMGNVYNSKGVGMSGVALQGFTGLNIVTDTAGAYTAFVDSAWSGSITPVKKNFTFTPVSKTYTPIKSSYSGHNYSAVVEGPVAVNLKVLLSGPYFAGSDTMVTTLNRGGNVPDNPPWEFSNKNVSLVYNATPNDILQAGFLLLHPEIVDWLCIRVLDSNFTAVDTVAALLRRDGRVLSTSGDTLITLDIRVPAGNYYVVIHHANHLAVMSSGRIALSSASAMYDFTTGLNKYYGADAKLLKTGLYGMYGGDANYDGMINNLDYELFETDNINALNEYAVTDFNMDGFVTSKDFMLLAPNKRYLVATRIP